MDKMYLAFYLGPASDIRHKIAHHSVCIWTRGRYSHVELIIDGVCYSSSARDGKVRKKIIEDINYSEKWDIYEISGDKKKALEWFSKNEGKRYDWFGIFKHVLPFLPNREDRFFCTEAVNLMLGVQSTKLTTPQDVFDRFVLNKYKTYIDTRNQPFELF